LTLVKYRLNRRPLVAGDSPSRLPQVKIELSSLLHSGRWFYQSALIF